LGIGKPTAVVAGADYVLSGFDKVEQSLVDEAIAAAAEAVKRIVEDGAQAAMNALNRRDSCS
jgi:peptidyl-tRNA hydrolase